MLKSYVLVALRTLRRNRGYAAINVAGLGVGLASVILIATYVRFEGSYDRFHDHPEQLYRVEAQQPDNEYLGSDRFAITPAGLSQALRERIPAVVEGTTVGEASNLIARPGAPDLRFAEKGVRGDTSFFRLFHFPLLEGDPRTALQQPDAIVLTASLARRLFGTTSALGRTVDTYSPYGPPEPTPLRVTGVAEDPPGNSHLAFSYVLSLYSDESYQENLGNWTNSSWYTYLRTRPGASPDDLDAAIGTVYRGLRTDTTEDRLYAVPLTSIHLRTGVNFGPEGGGDPRTVRLFSAIAVVILLLACVNYTNLATARSIRRAREVGLRKTVGAGRLHLVLQHLSESVVTALFGLLLALVLAQLALPAFGRWLDRPLEIGVLGGAWRLPMLALFTVGVGLVAGLYPAFVLTAARPAQVLRGHGLAPGGLLRLRSLLVVGQYAAAIVLIVGSLVVYRQLQFIRSNTTGQGGDRIVTVEARDVNAQHQTAALLEQMAALPGVVGAAASSSLPVDIGASTRIDRWEGHPEVEGEGLTAYVLSVGDGFPSVYPLPLVAGRLFRPDFPSDSAGAFLLNETAARAMGWTPQRALGQALDVWGTEATVVGVVRDFHMHSLRQPIAPLVIVYDPDYTFYVSLRLRSEHADETLAAIARLWPRFSNYPFVYTSLSDQVDLLYQEDRRLSQGVEGFTFLALFVASLGLLGLAASAAEQRTREIGVRKVLGAGVAGLMALLTRDFLRLVGIALLVAIPVAALAANRWLEGFAYRVALSPIEFVLAGMLALAIGALTVSVQAYRAASIDPVRALRHD